MVLLSLSDWRSIAGHVVNICSIHPQYRAAWLNLGYFRCLSCCHGMEYPFCTKQCVFSEVFCMFAVSLLECLKGEVENVGHCLISGF
jgi:hypothetical protein